MSVEMIQTAWVVLMLYIAGFALGLWQILSAPDRPNYPTSGGFKRFVMFWFMASLLWRATEINASLWTAEPMFSPPSQVYSSSLLCLLMVTFLVDHVRHWLPARTHDRIRQLLAIARCKPTNELKAAREASDKSAGVVSNVGAGAVSPALVELALQGVRVVGPNEGPEVLR